MKAKNKSLSSQYFQADFNLLKCVARENDVRLLSAMLVMCRFANGKPRNIDEKPFSITLAGANAISEKLHCRWETGKDLLNRLVLKGYLSKIPMKTGRKNYRINYHSLNMMLPVSIVDNLGDVTSAINRINQLENTTENDKHRILRVLLSLYKYLSMSDLGGFYGVFQEWDSTLDIFEKCPGIIKLIAKNKSYFSTYNNFICESLDTPEPTDDTCSEYWNALDKLKSIGLIYPVIVLLKQQPSTGKKELMFTIRINDYHADNNSDYSYINMAGDSTLAYYGNEDFNYDVGELYDDEGNLNNTENSRKVIRLLLPSLENDEKYCVLSVYRPRFRYSSPDIAFWNKKEEENINLYLERIGQLA